MEEILQLFLSFRRHSNLPGTLKTIPMNNRFLVYFLPGAAFCLLLAGCSSPAAIYDYNTKTEFSKYDSFSWMEREDAVSGEVREWFSLIRKSVDEELISSGLHKSESGGSLLATIYEGQKAPIITSRYGYTYWPARWGYGGYYQGIEQYIYPSGTLVIDLIDRQTQELVWRGSAPKVIRKSSAGKHQEDVSTAVAEILSNFPPPMPEAGSRY